MSIDIDKLEALARAATPGPWDTDEGGEVHSGGRTVYAKPWLDGKDRKDADMQYGAAADPQTTLALISRLREAEQREQALAAHVRALVEWADSYVGTTGLYEEVEAARKADTASLARLKAQWQAEALESMVNLFDQWESEQKENQDSRYPCAHLDFRSARRELVHEINFLCRQAEGGES